MLLSYVHDIRYYRGWRIHVSPEGNVAIQSDAPDWASVDPAAQPSRLSRRGFVRRATGAALAGAAGVPFFLSACGQPTVPASSGAAAPAPPAGAGGGTSKGSGAS